MKRALLFFEDNQVDNFYPLSLSHTTAELRCGILTLADKWSLRLKHAQTRYSTRDYLEKHLNSKFNILVNDFDFSKFDQIIFINPLFFPDQNAIALLLSDDSETALVSSSEIVAVTIDPLKRKINPKELTAENLLENLERFQGIKKIETNLKKCSYLWDLVYHNAVEINNDFKFLRSGLNFRQMFDKCERDDDALIYNMDEVYIGENTKIDGQVVLDARHGSIYIDSNVYIAPHTRVEGPAYIGKGTQLVGGKIREGCSFGPVCRIGGEVEESIFHGYSNKYHDGFIGHAYVGEWVNFGAMTTNSDLKNNYGKIKVELPSGMIDTGLNKVGSFIGDHTKTGIGTLLTTGMVMGFASNLFGGGLAGCRLLPSFKWGSAGEFTDYQLGKAIETAQVVMSRRDVDFAKSDDELFTYLSKIAKTKNI